LKGVAIFRESFSADLLKEMVLLIQEEIYSQGAQIYQDSSSTTLSTEEN
jgi:hypothetical protein